MAKFFCDCIKDVGVQGVHTPTALGNGRDRKRRAANDAMARATDAISVKAPDLALDEDDDSGDIVHGSKSWSLPLDIIKAQPDQQLIFGWASVIEKDGVPIVDKQDDIILIEDLEKAAYDFVIHSRNHGDMHRSVHKAKMIESMVFTKEKQDALNIDLGQIGWWVGFHVEDAQLWKDHKDGKRPEFSIGGAAIPVVVANYDVKTFGKTTKDVTMGGRLHSRFPFDQGAATIAHHILARYLANQQSNLIHEYTNDVSAVVIKASDRVSNIVGVLDQDDTLLQNTVQRMVDSITRASQRTGAKAVESLVGNPNRRLKPIEQAKIRALHGTLADNTAYWTKQYGKKRAAELVGRMYDKKGNLVIDKAAKRNINATSKEMAAQIIQEAIDKKWDAAKLSRKLVRSKLFSSDRAMTIARTEISGAQNLAMLQAGYEYQKRTKQRLRKIWLLGPNPCPICEENGGEEKALGGVFESGNFAPPVHPNCMCEIQLILA